MSSLNRAMRTVANEAMKRRVKDSDGMTHYRALFMSIPMALCRVIESKPYQVVNDVGTLEAEDSLVVGCLTCVAYARKHLW